MYLNIFVGFQFEIWNKPQQNYTYIISIKYIKLYKKRAITFLGERYLCCQHWEKWAPLGACTEVSCNYLSKALQEVYNSQFKG